MDHEWKPNQQRYELTTPLPNSSQPAYHQPSRYVASHNISTMDFTSTMAAGQPIESLRFSREPSAQHYGVRSYERFDPSQASPMPPTIPNYDQYDSLAFPSTSLPTLDQKTPYFVGCNAISPNSRYGQQRVQHFSPPTHQASWFRPPLLSVDSKYQVSPTGLAPSLTNALPSRAGASASFASLHNATTTSQQLTRQVKLYGRNRSSVNVTGSKEALQKLEKAVGVDSLVVKQQIYGNDRSVFNASLKHHEDKGSWPAPEQSAALDRMNEDELLRFGITADDCNIEQGSSIYPHGEPPYRTRELNLDGLLVLLRIVPKYHKSGPPDCPRVWALGIVDKFVDNTFQAKLFRAEKSPSTHELWFMREVIGTLDDFIEVWRPFVAQSSVLGSKDRYYRPVLKHPRQDQESDFEDEDDDGDPVAWSPQPQQKSKPRNLRRYNHTTARWSQYKHLSWEEILDEGKIPIEDFCGEVMLEVAARFSNKEIAHRTNAWRPEGTSENLVWQVIKKALMQTAGTPGWPGDYKEAYKQFEDIRVRNNVKRKEQAGRKSRIGIAPIRKSSATDSSRKSSAQQAKRRKRRKREVSDISLVYTLTDDLPEFTGDDARERQRLSEVSETSASDEEVPRASVRTIRKLRPRKAKHTAFIAKTCTNLGRDEEKEEEEEEEWLGDRNTKIKEEYDDEEGSSYEEDVDDGL